MQKNTFYFLSLVLAVVSVNSAKSMTNQEGLVAAADKELTFFEKDQIQRSKRTQEYLQTEVIRAVQWSDFQKLETNYKFINKTAQETLLPRLEELNNKKIVEHRLKLEGSAKSLKSCKRWLTASAIGGSISGIATKRAWNKNNTNGTVIWGTISFYALLIAGLTSAEISSISSAKRNLDNAENIQKFLAKQKTQPKVQKKDVGCQTEFESSVLTASMPAPSAPPMALSGSDA